MFDVILLGGGSDDADGSVRRETTSQVMPDGIERNEEGEEACGDSTRRSSAERLDTVLDK